MTAAPALAPADRAPAYHALSDETRLAIVEELRGGERCVCQLEARLAAAQSRLSFHLKVLREAGLVRDRKQGRWSYYALVPERFRAVAQALGAVAQPRPAGNRVSPSVVGEGSGPCCG